MLTREPLSVSSKPVSVSVRPEVHFHETNPEGSLHVEQTKSLAKECSQLTYVLPFLQNPVSSHEA